MKLEMFQGNNFRLEDLMEGFNGFRQVRSLLETQTTSDFPLLFADAIDRQLLVGYREAPATWRDYVRVSTVPDFRPVKRLRTHGLEGILPIVPEKAEYTAGAKSEEQFTYSVAKYGRMWDVSWETLRNDDLGALQDGPQRLGRGARRTEYQVATALFAGAAFRGAGQFYQNNRNAVLGGGAGNRELNTANLARAYNMMATVTDVDGQPVFNRPKYLVVPPALELTARNVLEATIIREMLTTTVEAERGNYWSQMLELRVNYFLPFADPAAGNTAWYLFSNPADIPAIEVGFLRGHEQPQLFMRAADAMPVGGGAPNPYGGDFLTDNVLFKVRHVVGGTRLDWRGSFVNDGL